MWWCVVDADGVCTAAFASIQGYTPYFGETLVRRVNSYSLMAFLDCCSGMEDVVVYKVMCIKYNCVFLRLYDFNSSTSCAYMSTSVCVPYQSHMDANVRSIVGVWSSVSRGVYRPDVVSYVSLLDRAESLPLSQFVAPWKCRLYEVVQQKVGTVSVGRAIVYCLDHLPKEVFERLRNHMDIVKSVSEQRNTKENFYAYVYQKLLSCLQEHDAQIFMRILE